MRLYGKTFYAANTAREFENDGKEKRETLIGSTLTQTTGSS
jgi:hypothetical protein